MPTRIVLDGGDTVKGVKALWEMKKKHKGQLEVTLMEWRRMSCFVRSVRGERFLGPKGEWYYITGAPFHFVLLID